MRDEQKQTPQDVCGEATRSSAEVVVLCMIWQESCHHFSSVHTLYLRRVSSALIHSYFKKNANLSLCVVSKCREMVVLITVFFKYKY